MSDSAQINTKISKLEQHSVVNHMTCFHDRYTISFHLFDNIQNFFILRFEIYARIHFNFSFFKCLPISIYKKELLHLRLFHIQIWSFYKFNNIRIFYSLSLNHLHNQKTLYRRHIRNHHHIRCILSNRVNQTYRIFKRKASHNKQMN